MVEILYPNGKIFKSVLSLRFDETLTSTGSQVDDHLIDWHFLSASGEQKFMKDHSIENPNPLSIFNIKCLETNQVIILILLAVMFFSFKKCFDLILTSVLI